MTKLPGWFRQDIPDTKALNMAQDIFIHGINTVCQEAKCPNVSSCFKDNHITFMILGNRCTRNCRFCNVEKNINSGLTIDEGEPLKIAEFVKLLRIQYAVVTSVTRDDLRDGGAGHFRRTIETIRRLNPNTKIEVLIPDFQGKPDSLKSIVYAKPDVLGHNLETVERLYAQIRPQANYQLSLRVLSAVKEINPQMTTKSSIMLGLGETKQEVKRAMEDLRKHNCDMLTLGQYLAPSLSHYPVKEFIHPREFKEYHNIALGMGFKKALSGPRVRSSYGAEKLSAELIYA